MLDTLKKIAPGDKLTNGATVVAVRPCPKWDNSETKAVVVLALWMGGQEYVTWITGETRPDATTWGHYFGLDFGRAVEDFNSRG